MGGQRSSKFGQTRYKYRLMEALRDRNIDPNIWLQIAQNRQLWRKLVNGKRYDDVVKANPKAKTKAPRDRILRRPAAAEHAQPKAVLRRPAIAEQANPKAKAKAIPKTKAKAAAKAKVGQPGVNLNDQLVKCPSPGCSQMCRGRRVLRKHTDLVHTQGTGREEGFSCDQCPYHSKNLRGLTIHKNLPNVHTPNAWICPVCLAHFPSRDTRNKHRSDKHGPNNTSA